MAFTGDLTVQVKRIDLALLENHISRAAPGVTLLKPSLRTHELIDQMIYDLSAYVLADHVDHQVETYQNIEFPKYLKWLKHFCKVTQHCIGIDAYWTYPKSNVAMPELGEARKAVTFYRTEI